MVNFKYTANIRVKQYLHHSNAVQDKKAIKGFFIDLRTKGLYAARRTALVRGTKNLSYLVDALSQEYINSHKF